MKNPFLITNYTSPIYFCDREQETSQIIEALEAGRSITLYSIRRMGKTGLIRHVFHSMREARADEMLTIYMDIWKTKNTHEFVQLLINKVLQTLDDSQPFYKKILRAFTHYKPKLALDPQTGHPYLELDIRTPDEARLSMDTLFSLIDKNKKTIVIAIDEFQNINNYPDTSIAPIIRGYLQSVPNLRFIFSGSQKHLLLEMFTSSRQALFRSTQLLGLDSIPRDAYTDFIRHHFRQGLQSITREQTHEILDWSCVHTFYTQYVANRLYARGADDVTDQLIREVQFDILKENEVVYYNYRNLLSTQQWKLLRAIAREEKVVEITAKDFLSKYQLGAHSTVRKSAQFLLAKELIYTEPDANMHKECYRPYDPFLMRWMQMA